ncbi:MAG: hypothetical protein NTU73_05545 [Ignavibacteriae bacterium]|nr:hypothetical protein [Ignavibacteriota bacterium]
MFYFKIEVWNIIINIALLITAIATALLVWRIYKYQRRDALDLRKKDIKPILEDGAGSFSSTVIIKRLKFTNNPAYNVDVILGGEYAPGRLDNSQFQMKKFSRIKKVEKDTCFSIEGTVENTQIRANVEYGFYVHFNDIDGNRCMAYVQCKGLTVQKIINY